VLLTRDGRAVCFGDRDRDKCAVPDLPEGLRYVHAAAGQDHTVLLTSAGHAISFGSNRFDQCWAPSLPEGERYVAAACGARHTVLVTSSGRGVVCGDVLNLDVPALAAKERFVFNSERGRLAVKVASASRLTEHPLLQHLVDAMSTHGFEQHIMAYA
jgi:alpha-tubulin suppressor-like RCC1 family protein